MDFVEVSPLREMINIEQQTVNWGHIIATVVISSITSVIVTQLQSWYTSRKEKRKTMLSTLEFFRAVLANDEYLLIGYINKIRPEINQRETLIHGLPLFNLNLYSSITDYVNVFKINTVLAERVMNHLYLRENLILLSAKNGLRLDQIEHFKGSTSQILLVIDDVIAFIKKPKLSKLKIHLTQLTQHFLEETIYRYR